MEMGNKMKVSVVIPTYRREVELMDALNSVAYQTYHNLEIILVDDNGCEKWNENVAIIVERFRSIHADIKLELVVNKDNLGSSRTRNIGVMSATGEYITFLDDDDVYLPDKVQRQLLFMEKGGYDFSITDLNLYNENGKLIDRRRRTYIQDNSQEALQRYHFMYHLTGTDTLMFRRDYFWKIQGFAPIDVGDEFYLMQRAIEGGGKFGYLPGCDVKAFVHTEKDGLSNGDSKIQGENAVYAFKKNHFSKIDSEARRAIRMRHYAVLAYAELRRKKYCAFGVNAIKSFLSAPMQCVTLVINRFKPVNELLECKR